MNRGISDGAGEWRSGAARGWAQVEAGKQRQDGDHSNKMAEWHVPRGCTEKHEHLNKGEYLSAQAAFGEAGENTHSRVLKIPRR